MERRGPETNSPSTPVRVVFDANLFIQALLSGRGPAFACFELIGTGAIELYLTESILSEIEEVLRRLSKKAKYKPHLSDEVISSFLVGTRAGAHIEPEPPHVFNLARDKDDEVYIDLAIAVGAQYLTSRDKDLLDLMKQDSTDGIDFRIRFPMLTIIDPVAFLREIRESI